MQKGFFQLAESQNPAVTIKETRLFSNGTSNISLRCFLISGVSMTPREKQKV